MKRMLDSLSTKFLNFMDILGRPMRGKTISFDSLRKNNYYKGKTIQFIYYYEYDNLYSRRIDIVDGEFIGLRDYHRDILQIKTIRKCSAYKWHSGNYLPTDKWIFYNSNEEHVSGWLADYILPKSIRILYKLKTI